MATIRQTECLEYWMQVHKFNTKCTLVPSPTAAIPNYRITQIFPVPKKMQSPNPLINHYINFL